ncbi:MAG: hypothetical protein ACKOWW_00210 [Flavobacteriales bacterium]
MFSQARARKKKGLTERIDILPFPKQSLRKSNKTNSTQKENASSSSANNSTSIVAQNTVQTPPPTLTKPQGQVKSNIISIREVLEKEKESINQLNQEDLPREGFHLDHVKMYWKQYAFQLKENGMETFYNALIKRDPILKSEETLELVVDNLVQQNYIQTHLLAFKDFMRKQLRNYHLDIQITLSEAGDEEVKFLTGKDKFAALARKNPNLHTLKNRFNLDIDY